MQEQHLYEYAVIRVVPKVEREEFVNVGIIIFCKSKKYLKAICEVDESRLIAFAPDLDMAQVRQNLDALKRISNGEAAAGPIALMDAAERFRWLTAVRSSVIQTSRPHPGFSKDLEHTAARLFDDMVAQCPNY